ncbi:type II toxin-antitoxin system RelE/ParE family toxin [Lichenibacterium dinghuense]|uniref:type II toxin-antitoxin system RelE/ParE family toxin n=1 Tax=Lichenibacterium dinghuense TaxID=2895977 RepID=UPI003D17508C
MPTLVFRSAARHDLAEIAAHIARGSGDRETGRRFARRLDDHCRRLARLPGLLGRPRPEFGHGYRTSAHEGHLIVFRYADLEGPRSHLIVIRILDGRRDLGAVFSEPETDL